MQTQPSSTPAITTRRLTIRFVGDPVGAALLVWFLRDEGLLVESEPPFESRGFEGEVSITATMNVSLDLAGYFPIDAIERAAQGAIDKVTRWTPRVEIQIEHDQPGGSTATGNRSTLRSAGNNPHHSPATASVATPPSTTASGAPNS